MSSESLFVGLMTGTSLDGVDAVLASVTHAGTRVLAHHGSDLPSALRADLQRLCRPGDDEIDRAGACHRALGAHYADAVAALLSKANVPAGAVTAIGCHGQTVRHRPGDAGFSVQLGCPDTLAVRSGLPVVSNFRNKDMVLGGQGAPLAPRFHEHAFGDPRERRVVLNLGGIANVSLLDKGALIGGFDTGPANTLLDQWHQRHQGGDYDPRGDWAAGGEVIPALLDSLLGDPYFHLPPPKSTGREYFHQDWLAPHLGADMAPRDVQATLAELTARTVAEAISGFHADRLLVCGGGVHNRDLLNRLARHCGLPAGSTEDAGVAPEWVEAAAFAWLAWAFWERVPGNAPQVTGAGRSAVLGHLSLP
ncbi:anhydro-N-acetylmuramic acid kinase [Alcanivorax venustensis ISO4]|uniref:Anhydro-N-acetylmuramic acid kinase n=1 Tax=Alloalcanivorax venustensis ISO4 TaxID=1177184 RepID=A0ABS0ABZ3_9GAMM|nr:anhydro-N-acetylmuramic acid kinase [Alloalcanivorax venustensis]MBF5051648.1 anhydro-N-acetylmuramic acid kinase [Alloalcanivorax venustensis ISO4]